MDVSLNHIPVINFSMQQNHVPVIREIILKNTGDDDLTDIDISISFDPEFAEAITHHIDRIPAGNSIRIPDIPVHISTSYLSNLTERISGLIKMEVKSGNEVLVSQSYDISVLAFDQWGGIAVLPAMLAAFVTPNHPEIAPIIKRASEILGKWTGSPSFDEYQTRDPNRVKLQMAAIYEAIAEQQIAYCTVPASFEDYGQRIRLYSDILSSKLGTCLDMTLLYAGCLEAVGIHPLIIVVQGHAFAGAWLIQESFPDSVNDDVSLLSKRIADGINEILLVETTCMNAGGSFSFDDAVNTANDKLKDTDKFQLFIDVLRARNAQIRPLPQRVLRDGSFEIEDEVVERNADAPTAVSATHTVNEVDHINIGKQMIWERKLLDLSLRNSLLNTRITKNTLQLISVNVNELEDALAAGAEFQILEKPKDWDNPLMSAGIYQSLNASNPIVEMIKGELKQKRLYSYLTDEALQKSMTYLYRSSRLSLEENGANTLYLAVGFLKWFETPSSTRPRFAPILLQPIEIIRRSAAKGYIIRSRDEDTTLNITLLEMLRQDFGIGIGGLDPLPVDGSGVDVTQIFNVFRRAIMSQTGWDVEEQAIIGNFSFNKFIMWNDIHNNADKLSRNKIVASLISGKAEWSVPENEGEEVDLDEAYPPGSVALPVSADSSQFEAICEAVDGKSFILHGPPGTGKSQTITNIIANALYNGKKVLFVAEKMAALQVVERRLAAIGLAPFCLELHSNKTKKSAILEQLKSTTEVVKFKSSEAFRIKAKQIKELRSELNGYVHAIHKVYPAGLSLYDCFAGYAVAPYGGELVRISKETAAGLTPASREEAAGVISEFQAIAQFCGVLSGHPLSGICLRYYNALVKNEAYELLIALSEEINRYRTALQELSAILDYDLDNITNPQQLTLNEILHVLLEAAAIPVGLLKESGNQALFAEIESAVGHGKARDAAREILLNDFTDGILSWDFRPWESSWRESSEKWWLPRVLGQNKVKSQLKPYLRGNKKISPEEVDAIFGQLDIYSEHQQELDKADGVLSVVLGSLWRNGNADWDIVESASQSVGELNGGILSFTRNIAKAGKLKESIARNLDCGLDAFRQVYGDRLQSVIDKGQSVADKTAATQELLKADSIVGMTLCKRGETLARWAENIESLHDWTAYNNQREKVVSLGFKELVDGVGSGKVPVEQIYECFVKSMYRSYAEFILSKETHLNAFHGVLFDEKIERFKRISAEFEQMTRKELFAKLASQLPALQKEAAQSSEVGILQRNIRNGGRGTSIRKLFDQIPELLTRMCPCMLMSPISVAQYIDAGRAPFDLVIFDEASQMPTSEAVGAIARGRNVIVVGDPKQMPPTNFFSVNTFDEDNADKEDMENILEDCLALTMPSKYLLWHYRSRHESLIAFSNVKYYDNKLFTFPSPDDLTTKVVWQHIEGIYDRGKSRQNRAEAEAIINEIEKRLLAHDAPKRSIGVVTFNTNQQGLIEDLLNDLFSHNPKLEAVAMELEEPIFIKNLENVQGDERDVILISIGYGPDKDGKIALNFGPLNRDGGGRRLNVAVSRARYEMKVFSTLKSEQIDLNRTSADGVADLKAFLEYAEKGRDYLVDNSGSRSSKTDDMLVDSISKALLARGHSVRTNIGCSGYKIDIGVVDPAHPDKYLLGILLDGYQYSSSRTANDRIVTQDSVLEQLGWRLHHVWAMDWWENHEKAVDSIEEAIKNVDKPVAAPVKKREIKTNFSNVAVASGYKSLLDKDSYKTKYKRSEFEDLEISPDFFMSELISYRLLDRIAKIIETEAPISKSLLSRRLINSFGITRMTSKISNRIDKLLERTSHKKNGEGDAVFYWKQEQNPEEYANYRPDSNRDMMDIAPEEVSVAICRVLEEQVSLPVDALKREVAQIFGYSRMSESANTSVNRAVDYALARGKITIQNDRIKLC